MIELGVIGRGFGWAAIIACASVITSVAHTMAEPHTAGADGREQLYVCGVGPTTQEGILELTAIRDEQGRYSALQFVAIAPNEAPIQYPAVPAPGQGAFSFSNTTGPDGYLVSIRFEQSGTKYRLYSLSIPANPCDPSDAGGGGGGLVITEPGKPDRKIVCGEAVYEFISTMQQAMSCDVDERYGPSLCDTQDVPLRVQTDVVP